jgi:peroxiredoxin
MSGTMIVFGRGSTWSLIGLVCATALVVLLALRLRSVRADNATLRDRERSLATGMYVPHLDLPLVTGGRAVIGAPEADTPELVFILNTTCGFCIRSLPAWQDLAQRVKGLGVQVHGLSLDSLARTRAYLEDHQLTFSTALLLDRRDQALLRADVVPQTLLVDARGLVRYARRGTFTQAAGDSIVALLRSFEFEQAPVR